MYLILVRHGESLWNAKGLWTGWNDVSLSEKGREEARVAAENLRGFPIDRAFVSSLKRAKETLNEILEVLNAQNVPVVENAALNERNYGIYTGENKWEIKKRLGDEEFLRLRRGWDYPTLDGESLKQVYERVVPYYRSTIEPFLKQGKNVLISAHGNSLRALVKYLEHIADADISKLEMGTGEIYLYEINSEGSIVSKKILNARPAT